MRNPYLVTEWDEQQWIIFANAYPHAINKANKEGLDHRYIREMDPDELPEREHMQRVGTYSHLSSENTEVWKVHEYCPFVPTDEEDEDPGYVEGEGLDSPYLSEGVRVFRVRVEPYAHGEGWFASTIVWQPEDDGDSTILSTQSSEAFFAYLNIKQTLDSMGVRGYIEPEFIPNGPRKGFYDMDSTQERIPLKAIGGS